MQAENQENLEVLRQGCLALFSHIITNGGREIIMITTAVRAHATSVQIGEFTQATLHALKLRLIKVSGASISQFVAAASLSASCSNWVCAGIGTLD